MSSTLLSSLPAKGYVHIHVGTCRLAVVRVRTDKVNDWRFISVDHAGPGNDGTVYVENLVGILFRKVVKSWLCKIFRCIHFQEYVACLVLRLVTDKFLWFFFSKCRSRLTREIHES